MEEPNKNYSLVKMIEFHAWKITKSLQINNYNQWQKLEFLGRNSILKNPFQ